MAAVEFVEAIEPAMTAEVPVFPAAATVPFDFLMFFEIGLVNQVSSLSELIGFHGPKLGSGQCAGFCRKTYSCCDKQRCGKGDYS
ncbi:hypothetical protein ABVF61_22250 [Roseibium sp. HPY-6]|uniref:hypothetical protein n=1 Tax=Roseibium sp. HPY-6 TaxID=3229852 RepID=UPI00338F1B92